MVAVLLRRVPRLDDASWSFFVFFSHDNIFMELALWEMVAGGCDASGVRASQLIKHWAVTAHAGPRGFAINIGAEAHAPSRRSAANI
jgi:hypothetical protein